MSNRKGWIGCLGVLFVLWAIGFIMQKCSPNESTSTSAVECLVCGKSYKFAFMDATYLVSFKDEEIVEDGKIKGTTLMGYESSTTPLTLFIGKYVYDKNSPNPLLVGTIRLEEMENKSSGKLEKISFTNSDNVLTFTTINEGISITNRTSDMPIFSILMDTQFKIE